MSGGGGCVYGRLMREGVRACLRVGGLAGERAAESLALGAFWGVVHVLMFLFVFFCVFYKYMFDRTTSSALKQGA